MSKKKRRNKIKDVQSEKNNDKKVKITKNTALPRPVLIASLLVFFALSFLLYAVSLDFGFVLDDKIVLSENNYTKQGLEGIPELFSTDSFQGYFGEQKTILQGGRYRPLSLVSFAIEYQLFGLKPMIYHLGNILYYAFSVFIAFIVLRRLTREETKDIKSLGISLAFITALIFLVHPIHTEAVANIKGRDEIMAFLFSMLCFLFSMRFYDGRTWKDLVLAILFYMLGLFSKENTITFLAIIPLGIVLFRKKNLRRLIQIVVALLTSTIVYLAIRVNALGYLLIDNPSTDIMNNPFVNLDFIQKHSTIAYTLLVYLKLNFIPLQLTHDYYPYHIPIMTFADWEVWLSIILHLIMLAAIVYFWKRKPIISFALGFYISALSIVSNIVVNVGTFMNERFAFSASLGMCLIIALVFQKLRQASFVQKMPLIYPILLGAFFLAFSFKTFNRVFAWEDELALNKAAIKVSKNSARANSFTATAYFNRYKEIQDRNEKQELLRIAKPYAKKAIEIYPNYLNANLMMAGILAEEYKYDNNIEKLLTGFREVANRRPDVEFLTEYLKYLNGRGTNIDRLVEFYIDLGYNIMYLQQKRYEWAIHYLLLANEISPNNPRIYTALNQAYLAYGRPDLARNFSQIPGSQN